MHLAVYQIKCGVPIWYQTLLFHPSCNSFRENKTQKQEREEKEDNDEDMKNACLIMLQILSLFHISSLSFLSKRNNWHMLYFESRLTQKNENWP